jgi:hypothetical protein
MAKLFQELQCHGRANFELEFIAMDPGYHEDIWQLFIPINIFESNIFEIVDNIAQDYPCYMCAKMRRGALYGKQWLSLARNIQTLLFPEKPAVAKHTLWRKAGITKPLPFCPVRSPILNGMSCFQIPR